MERGLSVWELRSANVGDLTAPARIYVNDAAREIIEKLIADVGLTGIECGPPQRF